MGRLSTNESLLGSRHLLRVVLALVGAAILCLCLLGYCASAAPRPVTWLGPPDAAVEGAAAQSNVGPVRVDAHAVVPDDATPKGKEAAHALDHGEDVQSGVLVVVTDWRAAAVPGTAVSWSDGERVIQANMVAGSAAYFVPIPSAETREVLVNAPSYEPERLDCTGEDPPSHRRIVLRRSWGVTGRVISDGGVERSTLQLLDTSQRDAGPVSVAASDEGGLFQIDAPSPGFYLLLARKDGIGTCSKTVEARIWESSEFVELVLGGGAFLSGRVVDQHNAPRPGIRLLGLHDVVSLPRAVRHGGDEVLAAIKQALRVERSEGQACCLVTSDDQGVFRATGLMPGCFTVISQMEDSYGEELGRFDTSADGLIVVLPLRTIEVALELAPDARDMPSRVSVVVSRVRDGPGPRMQAGEYPVGPGGLLRLSLQEGARVSVEIRCEAGVGKLDLLVNRQASVVSHRVELVHR